MPSSTLRSWQDLRCWEPTFRLSQSCWKANPGGIAWSLMAIGTKDAGDCPQRIGNGKDVGPLVVEALEMLK